MSRSGVAQCPINLSALLRMAGKFAGVFAVKLFYLGNLLIVVIMLVVVYVHLHPDVPAQVLPSQAKPPVVTIIVMLLAMLNIVLRRHFQPKPSRS